MMSLFALALASADLDALDQAVTRCERAAVNPVFAGESGRRSRFLLDAYREEEAIVAARVDVATRRREWRESDRASAADDKALKLEEAALEDRQRALNDQRLLEGIRQDAMDNMRRYYLMNCPAGKDIGK